MFRRDASLSVAAVCLVITAGCSSEVSRTAEIFYSSQSQEPATEEDSAVGQGGLAEVGAEALADAQDTGKIPDSVALRQLPDTVILEVVAHADDSEDAARIVNQAVDHLVTQLNGTDHGLDRGRFTVVGYATG